MRDSFNRKIDYVRLSVTDRCDLRCTYCMPKTGICFLKKEELLTFEEYLFLVETLSEQGIKKVKITGGEPLVRNDIVALIREMKQLENIEKVTLTTNGVRLAKYVQPLKEVGLDGLNISLDTLDPIEFQKITRVNILENVLIGLNKALESEIPNVKINVVARGELTHKEILALVELAKREAIHVRFIELMPIGRGKACFGKTQEEIFSVIESVHGSLTPFYDQLGNGPAHYFSLKHFRGKIGFISALGHCFCEECNRIRITANGVLKTCLHMDTGCDLKKFIRNREKELLIDYLTTAIQQKPEKHQFLEKQREFRLMSQIGG